MWHLPRVFSNGAQIVFHNGKPDRKNYRHYGLEVRDEGNNDFAMMKELMRRRIPKGNFPDVFIVDNGKVRLVLFSRFSEKKT